MKPSYNRRYKLWFVSENGSAYSELHGLGTRSSQLSGNNDLAALCTRLHDEPENTIACPSDSKTVEKLISEGLALCDSTETTVLDLGGVERDGVLGELEPLLDQGGEFPNAATLLTKNLLGVGSTDYWRGRCQLTPPTESSFAH